jgi:hypothetical protein
MKKIILCSLLATGMMVGVATPPTFAAKAKKQESEVDKALKQAYPDAQTSITGSSDVNGVKVHDVSVKTKNGESTAQITEYGDFLMYGVPHEYSAIKAAIQQDVGGVFKSTPEDIQMYRVTNYFVDFKGPKNKNFTARFDAVGRLLDIENAEAAKAKGQSGDAQAAAANRGERIKDDATVRQVSEYVKRELPEAKLEAVYPAADQGSDFMVAALSGGGEVILNKQGQVYSLRQPIQKEDFPEPVAKTIQGIFTAPIASLQRGEYEYYQFNQQSQQGSPIVVKMRPNGDILEVQNTEAIKSEEAVTAKSKSKPSGGAAKKG